MKNSERRVLYALSAIALLWAGMLIGVSFLATPVKFLAPFVALEAVWLLPVLDARVEIILNDGTPEESGLHSLYIGFESAKLLLLAAIAWLAHVAAARHVDELATRAR